MAEFDLGDLCVRVTDDRGQYQIDISMDEGREWHLVEDAIDVLSSVEGRLAVRESFVLQDQMAMLAEVRIATRPMDSLEKRQLTDGLRARKQLRGERTLAKLNGLSARATRESDGN